jgi:hypothetical protein
MKIHERSWLVKVLLDRDGRYILANSQYGKKILDDVPLGVDIEVSFKWKEKEKHSASFVIDRQGNIDSNAVMIMFKPGAKVNVEWEE